MQALNQCQPMACQRNEQSPSGITAAIVTTKRKLIEKCLCLLLNNNTSLTVKVEEKGKE